MTVKEKNEILLLHKQGKPLTNDLRLILIESLKNGEPSIFENAEENVCCDLGIDQPNRYQWISKQDCEILHGSITDGSKCGH